MALPAGVSLRAYSVEQAALALKAVSLSAEGGDLSAPQDAEGAPATEPACAIEAVDAEGEPTCVLLLLKSPQAALALVERGVRLPQLNVGNLGPTPGSTRAFRSISLNRDQAAALGQLAARGVQVTFQLTPDDSQVEWETVKRRHPSLC
jgi:PTS system mannose-specific IIB component